MANAADIGLKTRFENRLPTTKWPLQACIWRLYNNTQVDFSEVDLMRSVINKDGTVLYLFKGTGEVYIPPKGGLEDKAGNIHLVHTGEGEYKVAEVGLDAESKNIVLSLKDDENVKFIFAKNCEDAARRFQLPSKFADSLFMALLAFGIACLLMMILPTFFANGIKDALNSNTAALNAFTSVANQTLSAVGHAAAGAKPPI